MGNDVETPIHPGLSAILAEMRSRLSALYQDRLVHVLLFGSQARGDAVPGSDIDLLVILSSPVNPGQEIERTGHITSALSLKHDVVISCTFMSTGAYAEGESPFIQNIRREGLLVA